MSTLNSIDMLDVNIQEQIKQNFKKSDLTIKQYINACKQYLHAKRNDYTFSGLSGSEQQAYLVNNNVLGYRFLGDSELVHILKNIQYITLSQIYLMIMPRINSESYSDFDKIDFLTFLNVDDNILIVNPEMFLNQLSKICSSVKRVTMWTADELVSEILFFDYGNNQNIVIKTIDIYKDKIQEQEKFKNVLCIPPFRMQQGYKKHAGYAHGPSASAAELLIENTLTEEGVLTIVMPNNVNEISGGDEHFRCMYGKKLVKVIDLSSDAPRRSNIKSYLYQFSKNDASSLLIYESINEQGKEFKLADIVNRDSSWDFQKPLKKIDKNELKLFQNKNCKKLAEIATIIRGKHLSGAKYAHAILNDDMTEDFLYLDMRALKEVSIDYSKAEKYKFDKDLSSEYLQKGRDLLILNKGYSSKVVLFNKDDKNCIASDNIIVIRPKIGEISPEYLLMYLNSKLGQKLIRGIQKQTTIPYIKQRDMDDIIVIVPTLFEQKKLAKDYALLKGKYLEQMKQIKINMEKLEQDLNDIICGDKEGFSA